MISYWLKKKETNGGKVVISYIKVNILIYMIQK